MRHHCQRSPGESVRHRRTGEEEEEEEEAKERAIWRLAPGKRASVAFSITGRERGDRSP